MAICPEHDRLLRIIGDLTNEHMDAVGELLDAVTGQVNGDLLLRNETAERLIQTVEAAWEDYYFHIKEHGCR